MLRAVLIVPVLAVGLLVALIGSQTATHQATKAKVAPPAAPAKIRAVTPTALDASSGKATVTSTEFKFSAPQIDARAGKLTLTLHNTGQITHELVVLKSSADPASLKVSPSGRVSESSSVGEVSELLAGHSDSTTFNLKPGRYIYVCNIPGHYSSGMHGLLVVS